MWGPYLIGKLMLHTTTVTGIYGGFMVDLWWIMVDLWWIYLQQSTDLSTKKHDWQPGH